MIYLSFIKGFLCESVIVLLKNYNFIYSFNNPLHMDKPARKDFTCLDEGQRTT